MYDFRRHRVAEYPVAADKAETAKAGATVPSTITLSEIQRDRLTKIAEANWLISGEAAQNPRNAFDGGLVKQIYETELLVKEGSKPVPLQRVMILEVSQYLENYLWPNFDAETATFEHVMSMILMVNEKVWCFASSLLAFVYEEIALHWLLSWINSTLASYSLRS